MTLNAEIERTQAFIPDMTIDQSSLPLPTNLQVSEIKTNLVPITASTELKVIDIEIPQTEEEMIARAATLMSELEVDTGLLVDLPWKEILQREEQLMEELQEAKQEVEKVRTKYQQELKRKEAELTSTIEKLQSVQQLVIVHEQSIDNLSLKVKEITQQNAELLQNKLDLEEAAAKDKNQIALLTEQLDVLQGNLSQSQANNTQLEARINILVQEKVQLEQEKETLTNSGTSGTETTNDLEIQVQELSARILVKESDCSDLESKLESLQDLHSEQLGRVQELLDIETQNRLALEQERTVLQQKQADLASTCYQLEKELENEKSKKKAEPTVPPHIKKHYEDMEKKYIQAKKYV